MSRESLVNTKSRSRDSTSKPAKNDKNSTTTEPKPIRGRKSSQSRSKNLMEMSTDSIPPDDIMTASVTSIMSVDSAMVSSMDSEMLDSCMAESLYSNPGENKVPATKSNLETEVDFDRQVSATSDMGSSIDSRIYVSDSCAETSEEVETVKTQMGKKMSVSCIPLPRTLVQIKPNEEENIKEESKSKTFMSHILKARRGEISYQEAVKRLTKIPERSHDNDANVVKRTDASVVSETGGMQTSTDSIGDTKLCAAHRWSTGTMDASAESLAEEKPARVMVDSTGQPLDIATSVDSLPDGKSDSVTGMDSSSTVTPETSISCAIGLDTISEITTEDRQSSTTPDSMKVSLETDFRYTPDSLTERDISLCNGEVSADIIATFESKQELPETCDFMDNQEELVDKSDPAGEFKASPSGDFTFLEGDANTERTDFIFMSEDGQLVRSQISDKQSSGNFSDTFEDELESMAEVVQLYKTVKTVSITENDLDRTETQSVSKPLSSYNITADHVVTDQDDIAHIMRDSDIEVGSSLTSSTIDEISDRILDMKPTVTPLPEHKPVELSPRKHAHRLVHRRDSVDSVASYGSSLESDDLMMDQDLSDDEHEAPSDGRTIKLFAR